jgi:basic membrane lipoprotein Med (substrate-binding protein (PBP1-ABC) superfamily)
VLWRFDRERPSHRRWLVSVSLAAVVAALVVGFAVWFFRLSAGPAYDPPVRSRQYIAFTACLLTGPAGLADSQAKRVWSGMEAASTATKAQVTYLSAAVGQSETVGVVTPFANALVEQRCGLILAVGKVEVAATQSVAAAHAGIHFVLIGDGAAAPNVALVPSAGVSSIEARVSSLVKDAVNGDFHPGDVS